MTATEFLLTIAIQYQPDKWCMVDRKEKYKFDLGVTGLILESNVNMVSKQHKYVVGNVSIGEYC